jgi:hypothetical protein
MEREFQRLFRIRKTGSKWVLWKLSRLNEFGVLEYHFLRNYQSWQDAYAYAEHSASLYRTLGLTAPEQLHVNHKI